MRWLSLFFITIAIALTGITSAQAAVVPLKLKAISAQEQASTPGKVTVKYALTRAVAASETNQFTLVLRAEDGETIEEIPLVTGVSSGQFANIEGRTDETLRVTLIKKVPNRTVPIQVMTFSTTVKASTPVPNPADPNDTTDPSGTVIKPAEGCYKFGNTIFGSNLCAQDFLTRAYLWAVGVAIIGAAGMIIFAGYRYAVSRGNPAEVNNAREIIISTLVGLALLILSYTILQYFGVKVKTPPQTSQGPSGITSAYSPAGTHGEAS